MLRVLTIIPTYNEIESLPGTLTRLRAAVPHSDVLIADDNSPDGTGAWAAEFAATDPSVHVLHRTGKEGLGAAYLAGFAWGLAAGCPRSGRGPGIGFTVGARRQSRELAAAPQSDLDLWQSLFACSVRYPHPRRHRRLPGIPSEHTGSP